MRLNRQKLKTAVETIHTDGSIIPALGFVHIKMTDGEGSISGNTPNMNTTMAISGEGEGDMLIEHEKLKLLLMRSSAESVELNSKDGHVEMKLGKGKYKMATMDKDNMIYIKDEGEPKTTDTVSGERLVSLIRCTIPCLSTDDTRTNMTGVHMIFDETLKVAGSDSYKMFLGEMKRSSKEKLGAIVPPQCASLIAKLSPKNVITIEVYSNAIRFEMDSISVKATLIQGQIPPYETVIPQGGEQIDMNIEEMKQSIERLNVLTSKEHCTITIESTDGDIQLGTHNSIDQYEGEETLEGKGDIKIGINSHFLLSLLKVIDEGFIEYCGENKPLKIKNDKGIWILMPFIV